jgi:hypothetical protein
MAVPFGIEHPLMRKHGSRRRSGVIYKDLLKETYIVDGGDFERKIVSIDIGNACEDEASTLDRGSTKEIRLEEILGLNS